MEPYSILEARIAHFISLFKSLKAENLSLKNQVDELKLSIEHMQNTLLSQGKNAADLSEQQELADMALSDLIKSLDFLEQAEK